MPQQKPLADHDPLVSISDYTAVSQFGDTALLGNWFVFLKPEWFTRTGIAQLLTLPNSAEHSLRPTIVFRGNNAITLPGAKIEPTPLPRPNLASLTSDKALYRTKRDTVRLLIAAPQHPTTAVEVRLSLDGNLYATFPLTLDEYGLSLLALPADLLVGEYTARLEGLLADECRFEVAEYRLAPLNVELLEQQLTGDVLRYVLSVTAFHQPYTGSIDVELQERGQRIGERVTLRCHSEGQCRGTVKLAGIGPYTLNIIAGERTATVALKGSEQQRRETLTISELGEVRELSLLPLPQSNACKGMYIARGGSNNAPFVVRRVIGDTVEITPRTTVEALRIVIVDPAQGKHSEQHYEQVKAEQSIRLPIAQPYGIVLLGAFIDGAAWEGWCAVLCPTDLQLQCEVPAEARPGSRITITLKTGLPDSTIPVQLIVKDQRLIAPSDPQVELAACIKKNLTEWREHSITGSIERQLAQLAHPPYPSNIRFRTGGRVSPSMMFQRDMQAPAGPSGPSFGDGAVYEMGVGSTSSPDVMRERGIVFSAPTAIPMPTGSLMSTVAGPLQHPKQATAPAATLTKMRLQFPEIIYNNIVKVKGQASVEVTLGDSMTLYTIEAFALAPALLDWQRVETTVNAVQPVYGELTVSPFVFPGDPVMGRLDIGASSGAAMVEVRHDGALIPLFLDDGTSVTPGLPVPSGSIVRFPVRPGAITATVRDARTGEVDVSERHVTKPGQLRHILRRLRLLQPGDEVTLQTLRALELKPMPALDRPFQLFVEGAVKYPYGCVEQTSCKLLAMYTGYITNQEDVELARDYESAILIWYKRLESMYLPQNGFCLYPPQEGGARRPDTHYAPLAVKHLLSLPTGKRSGIKQSALLKQLDDIQAMASDAARYYKLDVPPRNISDCHAAYQVLTSSTLSQQDKANALAFVRAHLTEQDGRIYVVEAAGQSRLYGSAVSTRAETAYAAAALLIAQEPADVSRVIAATNYVTSQLNEDGRLYSTVDTAACLALMLALRNAGIISTAEAGRVVLNGQDMTLVQALAYPDRVESLRCQEGVLAVQVTSEIVESWSTYKSKLPVEVRLEKKGQTQERFKVGDELDLVISVPQYEPGLLAHVCLPDALARIVGGGQVKRFSLDFCEKSELRIPLAAISPTALPAIQSLQARDELVSWLGMADNTASEHGQHWAVIVRNMFKEEQIGNPGLMQIVVE